MLLTSKAEATAPGAAVGAAVVVSDAGTEVGSAASIDDATFDTAEVGAAETAESTLPQATRLKAKRTARKPDRTLPVSFILFSSSTPL